MWPGRSPVIQFRSKFSVDDDATMDSRNMYKCSVRLCEDTTRIIEWLKEEIKSVHGAGRTRMFALAQCLRRSGAVGVHQRLAKKLNLALSKKHSETDPHIW